MAKRFEQRVNIQQQNLSTGFSQGVPSLLNRLQNFKQAGQQFVEAVEVKRGQEEAQQAIAEGKPFERKEAGIAERILTGGVAAKEYNKAVETAYLSGIARDTAEAINQIEAENSNNIGAFNDIANKKINGILKGVDPAIRSQAAEYAQNRLLDARMRVHRNTIKTNKAKADAESISNVVALGNDAAKLARDGNGQGAAEQIAASEAAINGLVESGAIKADKAANMKREIKREAFEQEKRGKLENMSVEQSQKWIDENRGKTPKGWTPDEWDTFTDSAQADTRQRAIRIEQAKTQQSIETSKQVSDLKIAASTGFDATGQPVDPGKIIQQTEVMFKAEKINGSTRSSVITSVINRQKKELQLTNTKQKVADRLSGSSEVALTQKDVDTAWGEYEAGLQDLPPIQRNAKIADFINSTKIVPSNVVNQVNNNLNSDDAELVTQSADLMDRIDSLRGVPQDNFSPNDRAYANAVTGLSQNLEPVEAIKIARQNTDPNDKGRIEIRKQTIKDEKFADDYTSIVDDAFDPFFGSTTLTPITQGQLSREYESLFEQHFIAGMSKKAAKNKSLEIIKRNWKDSNYSGKARAMKYPPDDYYAVNGDVSYIGKQLGKAVIDMNVGLPEFKQEDLILISDDTTARQAAGGKPGYMVMINAGDNGMIPIAGFRFFPDVESEVNRIQKLNEKQTLEQRQVSVTNKEVATATIEGLNL